MKDPEMQSHINHSYNIILTIRWKSSSWASPSGIILMGGDVSDKTTEQIQEDGTSTYSFALKHALRLFWGKFY